MFQLFKKALLPPTLTIRDCLLNWPELVKRLSERKRSRSIASARLKAFTLGYVG